MSDNHVTAAAPVDEKVAASRSSSDNKDDTKAANADSKSQVLPANEKGDKTGGVHEEGISLGIEEKRIEASGVSSSYERKVFILNRVMNDHIGMGRFQWALFLLCGAGWFFDNVFLQGVAIILPAVQREFGETQIPWMTFALYIGLIIGAAGWGALADIIGRRPAFNATLGIAGIFSIAAVSRDSLCVIALVAHPSILTGCCS